MISYISGKLAYKSPTHVIIEANGIGYHLNISLHTFSKLRDAEQCRLHTYLRITEDAHALYGFADEEERHIFLQLISVSGIGPNTARLMLSSLSPSEIQKAIVAEDVALIQSIKGIGAKTAQRVIVDLKDKLKKDGIEAVVASARAGNKIQQEALSALLMLGFAKNVAEKALSSVARSYPEASVEELIKASLKLI